MVGPSPAQTTLSALLSQAPPSLDPAAPWGQPTDRSLSALGSSWECPSWDSADCHRMGKHGASLPGRAELWGREVAAKPDRGVGGCAETAAEGPTSSFIWVSIGPGAGAGSGLQGPRQGHRGEDSQLTVLWGLHRVLSAAP